MGQTKGGVSIPLYILVILFNISSWIDLDALWAELPLLVNHLPEYWALPSYIILIVDVTAIFPILYHLGNKYKPKIIREVPVIYVVIGTGFVGSILMIFLWHKTAIIGGERHSIAFFCLCFLLATVDSTSTVAFLAYLARLPEGYISAFYVGEGLCGFIPSVFALIQGAGEYDCVNTSVSVAPNTSFYTYVNDDASFGVDANKTEYRYQENITTWEVKAVLRDPVFSIEAFLAIISVILAISGISFSFINFHPWCKKHHVKRDDERNVDDKEGGHETKQAFLKAEHKNGAETPSVKTEINGDIEKVIGGDTRLPRWEYVLLLAMMGWQVGIQYGVGYSVQSYSLLPYGNLAFSLGNRLNRVVLPLASFAAYIVKVRSTKLIALITALGTVPAIYITFLAARSPEPPLVGTTAGAALAVFAWLSMTILWGYVKVSIGVKLHNSSRGDLMAAGSVSMVTLMVINVCVFLMINVFGVFKDSPFC